MEIANESSPLQEFRHGLDRTYSTSSSEHSYLDPRMPQKPKKSTRNTLTRRPPYCSRTAILAVVTFAVTLLFISTRGGFSVFRESPPPLYQQQLVQLEQDHDVSIAFVGNSMFYFNDFPRLFQVVASPVAKVYQNSILHGGGSIPSLYMEGNAMFPQFGTPEALIDSVEDDYIAIDNNVRQETQVSTRFFRHGNKKGSGHPIYDYGACTVNQLLTGTDDRLDDPGYAIPTESNSTNKNPCREDAYYLEFSKQYFAHLLLSPQDNNKNNKNQNQNEFHWDYVFINDNTRNPARKSTRARSLQFLEQFYVPLLQKTGATPIFLWTHAYSVESTQDRSMNGLDDVANFTSLTHVGYQAYSDLLALYLPEAQAPRIAPVGLAFLLVYEERPDLWPQLFHSDHIHASPSGSFLQACICHYTVFHKLPPKEWMVRSTQSELQALWKTARMMQHAWEPANPIPSPEMAEYLYGVAERIMVQGVVPQSYIPYQNGEVAFER